MIYFVQILYIKYVFLQVRALDPEDPLEEGMVTHSSILA